MDSGKPSIAVILGTRPNFIKAAPFFKQAQNQTELDFSIIHTQQHYDRVLSNTFFDEMEIPTPDIFLKIPPSSSSQQIGLTLHSLSSLFSERAFDGVVVFGDVDSTLLGTVTAVASSVSVAHIESGLRSHDKRMPEEMNRIIVDHLSDILFTTEPSANENLATEGISQSKIKYFGNILAEGIELFWDKISTSTITKSLNLTGNDYCVITIHRYENTENPLVLKAILTLINDLSKKIQLVFPLHPGTRKRIQEFGLDKLVQDTKITDPLGYSDFVQLMVKSRGVITDSGGIQEETSYLGIPCCTLRDNTERPITIDLGSNKLFSIYTAKTDEIMEHLGCENLKSRHIPLWDNKVSERIINTLSDTYIRGH